MSDKYVNEKGVYIETHTDKSGKDHISFYDKSPREKDHKSIHINIDTNTGKGNISDTTSGSKESTDTSCFLTTACMRYFGRDFDDDCYELRVLRWFRDRYVDKEDIEHYYKVAPAIVEAINEDKNAAIIYEYIYDNVVEYCVEQIETENYDDAYARYKDSVTNFERTILVSYSAKQMIKTNEVKSTNE